ncbi:MAG: hypothetical protein JXQ72_04420 [Anaerolineae bacterium]|nr:hypothetical protein [Anaerolineae bacterium]
MFRIFIGLCVWLVASIPSSLIIGKLLASRSKYYAPSVVLSPDQPVRQETTIEFEPTIGYKAR